MIFLTNKNSINEEYSFCATTKYGLTVFFKPFMHVNSLLLINLRVLTVLDQLSYLVILRQDVIIPFSIKQPWRTLHRKKLMYSMMK